MALESSGAKLTPGFRPQNTPKPRAVAKGFENTFGGSLENEIDENKVSVGWTEEFVVIFAKDENNR